LVGEISNVLEKKLEIDYGKWIFFGIVKNSECIHTE
jgi:hypothetical protein